MFVRLPLIAFALAAVSANPADELRTGIQFLEAGNPELALSALERAAERSDDPGLVAFNRGVALVQLNRHREAELQFLHCLDDGEIPAERRAKALYNRGVCLLARGDDLAALRSAIDCFAASRDAATDSVLIADVKHNLEVAKVRWLLLRAKEKQPPSPNESGSENPPPKTNDVASNDGNPSTEANANGSAKATPTTGNAAGANAKSTPQVAPGAGTLPVLKDDAVLTPLSPEDTQAYLELTAKRLARQRQSVESQRGGPDRPGVRDW